MGSGPRGQRTCFLTAPVDERVSQDSVTHLLQQVKEGDRLAFDELFALVYDELRQVAERRRRGWAGDETLNTTALVHETYLRLADQSSPDWDSRPHFLAVASKAMRQILLDYAKRKRAARRGGGTRPLPIEAVEAVLASAGDPSEGGSDALIALDETVHRLERHDPQLSRIVECRFYGQMTIADTATALGVSPATVKRGWALAQAWLYRDLRRAAGEVAP